MEEFSASSHQTAKYSQPGTGASLFSPGLLFLNENEGFYQGKDIPFHSASE
jgi:hypothetical protein